MALWYLAVSNRSLSIGILCSQSPPNDSLVTIECVYRVTIVDGRDRLSQKWS